VGRELSRPDSLEMGLVAGVIDRPDHLAEILSRRDTDNGLLPEEFWCATFGFKPTPHTPLL
jgi:hypothetical protein